MIAKCKLLAAEGIKLLVVVKNCREKAAYPGAQHWSASGTGGTFLQISHLQTSSRITHQYEKAAVSGAPAM